MLRGAIRSTFPKFARGCVSTFLERILAVIFIAALVAGAVVYATTPSKPPHHHAIYEPD
jgi:hypothetical protein